jgi:hypothetical protein
MIKFLMNLFGLKKHVYTNSNINIFDELNCISEQNKDAILEILKQRQINLKHDMRILMLK